MAGHEFNSPVLLRTDKNVNKGVTVMTDSKYFKTRFTYEAGRDRVWKVLCSYFNSEIKETDAVLDLGDGYCNFINNIKAGKKYAVDTYPDFKKNAAVGVTSYVCDSSDISALPTESLDAVFSSNMLEHLTLDKILLTVKEAHRVLKKGGKVILVLPNFRYSYKTYYDDYTHITPLTDTGVCDLLRSAGLEIKKSIPKFLPFSFKSRLPKSPFLVWLYLSLPFKFFPGQMLVIAEKL
jgi:SAM-dependent methyltransferase